VTYISVPVPAWESVGESPLRTTPLVKPPAPEGAGVGGGASLGTWSINDTPSSTPSQTAWESYRKCPGHIKAKYNKLFLDFCDYMQMCDSSGFSAEGIAVGSQCHAYAKHTVKVVNYISGEIGYPLPPKSYNDFGRRKVSGPLLNRWHPKRRAGWIARMYHLAMWYEANKIEGCTMISMTGYQENSGLS
jgi:hypothetical protein